MLVINRLSDYFRKANLATNDTNEHELKGNMQKATSRLYNQCSFVKSVAGIIILFLFGTGYAGLGLM